jgi:ATP synthase protein I
MRQNNRHPLQAYALMSAILAQLAGSVLIGVFVGKWLDRIFGAEPFFLIFGVLVGLATGVYAMIRLVQHFYSGE